MACCPPRGLQGKAPQTDFPVAKNNVPQNQYDMLKVALFDLDGVIIDTEPQYSEFWKRIGERDFPEDKDFAHRIKGSTLVQIFDAYYAGDEAAQARITEEVNRFENHMDYPLVHGAIRFVDLLRSKGIVTAVVTSSNQAKMQHVYALYADFAAHFDRIFTAEDATRSKPAPDCYLNAASFFGASPKDCCVFEDSLNGVKAGKASGAYVVGLTTTNARESLAPYCNLVADDYSALSQGWLDSML